MGGDGDMLLRPRPEPGQELVGARSNTSDLLPGAAVAPVRVLLRWHGAQLPVHFREGLHKFRPVQPLVAGVLARNFVGQLHTDHRQVAGFHLLIKGQEPGLHCAAHGAQHQQLRHQPLGLRLQVGGLADPDGSELGVAVPGAVGVRVDRIGHAGFACRIPLFLGDVVKALAVTNKVDDLVLRAQIGHLRHCRTRRGHATKDSGRLRWTGQRLEHVALAIHVGLMAADALLFAQESVASDSNYCPRREASEHDVLGQRHVRVRKVKLGLKVT